MQKTGALIKIKNEGKKRQWWNGKVPTSYQTTLYKVICVVHPFVNEFGFSTVMLDEVFIKCDKTTLFRFMMVQKDVVFYGSQNDIVLSHFRITPPNNTLEDPNSFVDPTSFFELGPQVLRCVEAVSEWASTGYGSWASTSPCLVKNVLD